MIDTSEYAGSHGDRFGEVLAEILLAQERGAAPELESFLRRHPDLEEPLRAYFRDRECFARVAGGWAARPGGGPTTVDVPGYEVLGELGRGGMGVVYRARQVKADRVVALKMILAGAHAGPEELARFRTEVEAVARLSHPNIVQIYEVGEHNGLPFFSLEFCPGGNFDGRLSGTPLPPREAAALVQTLARAIQAAHVKGVVHRDLKPANVLLAEDGTPKVTDFGLAKKLDEAGRTQSGAVVGTPSYMAPEQAAGRATVGPAADVYALGAILYECLTGRPPFRGATALETLEQVCGQEPVPVRRLQPKVPRDLETICLKCLHKEPARRYASAADLADDLRRFLSGEPIRARPVGRLERGWRWCRRNPATAAAAAVALAVAVVAFVLIAASRTEAIASRNEALTLADDNWRLAKEKAQEARNARSQEKKVQREATLMAFQQATTLAEQGELGRALHVLAHGLALAELAGADDLEGLFRANLAAWRPHLHALRHTLPHPAGVSAVAWSPDGRTLATACWDRTTRLWDMGTGKPRGEPVRHEKWVTGLAFSPDGKTLLTVGNHKVVTWEVQTGRRLAELSHNGTVLTAAVFAPDGRTILTGAADGKARFWDLKAPQRPRELSLGSWVEAVAFSPDGRFFATGSIDGRILVWAATGGRPLVTLEHPGGVNALALSADGRLLSGGEDRTARLWDLRARRVQALSLAHQAPVKAVALSPDGSLALTGSLDRTARVWDAATGRPLGQPLPHPGEVIAVAFGPDGRTVATGQGRTSGDARVFDVGLGNPRGGPLAHADSILALAVSPDGQRVATAGRDHSARLWDARTGEPVGGALPHNAEVNAVTFSPDGKTLASGGDDGVALFWQAADGRPVTRYISLLKQEGQIGVGLKRGVIGFRDPTGFGPDRADEPFWGPARGKSTPSRVGKQLASVFSVAFRPDGKALVLGGQGGPALLCDARRGQWIPSMRLEPPGKKPPFFIPGHRGDPNVYVTVFSPDGRLVAVAGHDGNVRLWDGAKYAPDDFLAKRAKAKREELPRLWDEAAKARLVGPPLAHGGRPVVALAFSPDSKTLLTGCGDGKARLWDVATGKVRQTLPHQGPVVAVAFGTDGQTLVTGSWDGTARVWKAATGKPACPPLTHQGKVLAVALSRDCRTVLTGSEDWTARLWDAATGQPVGPPLRHRDQVRAVAFGPDGSFAVTAGDDREARLWPVPSPAVGAAERLRVCVEGLSGLRRGADGSFHLLEIADWQEAVSRTGRGGKGIVAPEDRAGWHRHQARAAEAAGRWPAAVWHLDRLVAASPADGWLLLQQGRAARVMRDYASARRALDKAVEALPGEWEPWFRRGELCLKEGRWQEAVADLDQALLRRRELDAVTLRGPGAVETSRILHARGFARASLGQWKEASAELRHVAENHFAEIGPDPAIDYSLALLALADTSRHAGACRAMLTKYANPKDELKSNVITYEFGRREVHQYGKPFDPEAAARMAWVCCLSPAGLTEFAVPLRLARRAAALDAKNYPFARAFGAALYRAGEYEAAVKQLEVARALRKEPSPAVWLFLAMAHQRCGRPAEAREWLKKARAWIDEARQHKPDGSLWERLPWGERLALDLLRREADKLIPADTPKP
jgi:WD40 repeat protein/tetratricopeptide (TPR) repeat protein